MKSAWPTGAEIREYVEQTLQGGVSDGLESLDWDAVAGAALDTWETETGFRPFMASATESTRRFDPPAGKRLDLRGGLVVAPSEVRSGVTSTYAGEVVDSDYYWFIPSDYVEVSRPIEWIEFDMPQVGGKRSIAVTGYWGFCANGQIPDGAWLGVLHAGVCVAIPLILRGTAYGMRRLSEGDVSYEFDDAREAAYRGVKIMASQYRRLWLA